MMAWMPLKELLRALTEESLGGWSRPEQQGRVEPSPAGRYGGTPKVPKSGLTLQVQLVSIGQGLRCKER